MGVCTFLVAAAGFFFSASERRPLIMAYGALTALLALGTIVTVFLAMLTRSSIVAGAVNLGHRDAFVNYNNDSTVRDKWDYLQKRLRCCGALGFENYHVSSTYIKER